MAGPSYELIVAAVGGDKEALEKIIQYYEPIIEKESQGNPEIRKKIIAGLTEAILRYDLNDPEKNEEYLRSRYPDQY